MNCRFPLEQVQQIPWRTIEASWNTSAAEYCQQYWHADTSHRSLQYRYYHGAFQWPVPLPRHQVMAESGSLACSLVPQLDRNGLAPFSIRSLGFTSLDCF